MGKGHDQHAVIRSRLRSERGKSLRRAAPVALLYQSVSGGSEPGGVSVGLEVAWDAGFQAERAFLPDDVTAWKRSRVPLHTYETERPSHFPVIGISLAYELELAGLIEALEMAGTYRCGRTDDRHPRIIMGGPLTFSNPLPAAPFVDAMIVGEADDAVVDAAPGSHPGRRVVGCDRRTRWGLRTRPSRRDLARRGQGYRRAVAGVCAHLGTRRRTFRHVLDRGRARVSPHLHLLRHAPEHQRGMRLVTPSGCCLLSPTWRSAWDWSAQQYRITPTWWDCSKRLSAVAGWDQLAGPTGLRENPTLRGCFGRGATRR